MKEVEIIMNNILDTLTEQFFMNNGDEWETKPIVVETLYWLSEWFEYFIDAQTLPVVSMQIWLGMAELISHWSLYLPHWNYL